MSDTLVHRGPDDHGTWADHEAGIGLGFRRLSIIDLSVKGRQPMHSASGRYVLVFNGEIYNYLDLRHDLAATGARFRSQSDTEVILAGFDRWGVENTIRRLVGMFAIAVWDRECRSLTLIRDQIGIKPLFVFARPGFVSFGSELKALRAGPWFDTSLDQTALTTFLRYLYIPAPQTIYRHATKLLPGHLLTITDPDQPLPAAKPYWSARDVALRGLADPFRGGLQEGVEALDALLSDAVRRQMRSDVPLGALLSGGIDSSLLVALMQEAASTPVRTFSIGFDEPAFDESHHAARVAEHLRTDHTEMIMRGEDALEVIPQIPDMFDEPFADPSQIPTFLVCKLARQHVTVALSGDGGDELFAGYHRYIEGRRTIAQYIRIPSLARRIVGGSLGMIPGRSWDRLYSAGRWLIPARLRHRRPGEKLRKLALMLPQPTADAMYRSLISVWQNPTRFVVPPWDEHDTIDTYLQPQTPADILDRMMLLDQVTYLPDDLLAKTDRTSMSVGLEVRVPLLDHRVVEFSWRLPHHFKIQDATGKLVLRRILGRRVPASLVERPKMGFSPPIAEWLAGPLRAWAGDLLGHDALGRFGELDVGSVSSAWTAFLKNGSGSALGLWAILMYQAWKERWLA